MSSNLIATMELPFPTVPALCAFLLFLFILVKPKPNKPSTLNLPPGPWKLPFIGNIHHLLCSLPHQKLADLAKNYGPLMHLQLGEIPAVVVSSAEAAEEVLKNHDIAFADRPFLIASSILFYGCMDIAFSPYGSYWRQLRKICAVELLSQKRVQSFRSIREEEVSNLIQTISLAANSPINLSEKLFLLTNTIISRAAVGKKCRDQDEFIATIQQFLSISSGFALAEMYPSIKFLQQFSRFRPKLEKLHHKADSIIEDIIKEHKSDSQVGGGEVEEDLIHILLKLQEQGNLEVPLPDAGLKAVILDVLTAGTETSSSTLEWAMSELVKNPRVMKEAQEEVRQVFDGKGSVDETGIHELKFLKSVVKETLRLHPPVSLIPRECGTSCDVNGYSIPAKTKVMINAWAIGRDPRYWIEAERFHPERFLDSSIDYKGMNFEYLPFGSGRRICPGISMGLANVELPLAQLLYHFDWKLANGLKPEDLDMTEANGLTISKKEKLYLIPTPYDPARFQ